MKICLDIRYLVESGASTYIKNVVPLILQEGRKHEFVVITHCQFPLPSSSSVTVHRMPFMSPFRQFLWTQTILPILLRKWDINVYHSLKHLPPFLLRRKTIYSSGSVGYFTGDYPSSFSEHIYWRYVAKKIFQKTEKVIAVSDQNRNVFINVVGLEPECVPVIHHGIDSIFEPMDKAKAWKFISKKYGLHQPFLLCVGNIFPVKNHRIVVNAYERLLLNENFAYDLVFIGRDDHVYARELKEYVRSEHLSDRIHFAGFLPKTCLQYLYNTAFCLIQPSLHEGFGLAPLEAMACGLPVICSDRGGLKEVCGVAALYLHDPNDANALAHKVNNLLRDPKMHDKLRIQGIKRAAQFTWFEAAKRTSDIYVKLQNENTCKKSKCE